MSAGSEAVAEVRGVLLPLHGKQLLLPNASVSEVVGYQQPPVQPDLPDWLLGIQPWRQQEVPLVYFERLVGVAVAEPGIRARVAICNALGGDQQRPFIGILLSSIPRLVRVNEEVIAPLDEPADLGPELHRQVIINGEEAWIPDILVLDRVIREALS